MDWHDRRAWTKTGLDIRSLGSQVYRSFGILVCFRSAVTVTAESQLCTVRRCVSRVVPVLVRDQVEGVGPRSC